MNRERLVPKLRFEEFENDEEWVTYELGDISDVTKLAGFEYTKYVIYSEIGSIIALRGLNIKNGKIILDDVKYIDQSDFSKLDRSKLYQGDIILTYVGTIGNLAVIPENDKYYLAPNVARIRLTAGINPEFVTQRMGSRGFYRKIINPLIATSSQPALSMLNIRKFTLKIPGYKEQVKIGSHLKKLDELIQLQQSKVNKIKDLKSAYLSEMFPKEGEKYPKKRFEGLKNNWNQAIFSDFLKTESFKKYIAKNDRNGMFPIIQQGDSPIEGYGDGIPYKNYDSVVLFGDHTLSLFRPESPFLIASDGIKILSSNKMDRDYLYYLLQRYMPESEGYKRHYSILKNKVINITENKEEQIKIGIFFKNLDKQISIQEEKLAKLEKLKQAYLNDMFV